MILPVNDWSCLTYSKPVDPMKLNLLLLPPIQGSLAFFNMQLRLSKNFNLFFWTYRQASIKENAQLIAQAMPVEKFLVVGLSIGGLIGWQTANLIPHRVLGLVTVGSLPHKNFLRRRIKYAQNVLRYSPTWVFDRWYKRKIKLHLTKEGITSQDISTVLHDLPSKWVWCQRIGAIFNEFPMQPPLTPNIWIWGNEDPFVSWSADQVTVLYPNAQVVCLPGRHFPNYSSSECFARTLVEFTDNLAF